MLLKLLTLPVTGPIRAVEHVARQAMQEIYDPAKIMADYEALRARRDAGEITEDDYKVASRTLNDRFRKARDLHMGSGG